jgi:S1-C subfamily serine protease
VLIIPGLSTSFVLLRAAATSALSSLVEGRAARIGRHALIMAATLAAAAMLAAREFSARSTASASSPPPPPADRQAAGQLRRADFDRVVYVWQGLRMVRAIPTAAFEADTRVAGMRVESVEPGSPAAAARLRPGDVIAALDGTPVGTARGFALAIADRPSGPAVRLTVWRGNRPTRITMSLAAPRARAIAARRVRQQATPGRPPLLGAAST